MPYILNEDAALKTLLTGITVADTGNSARPVGVFYGQPDKEIRQQSYPYITIDLIGVAEDPTRAHRGYVDLIYTPEGADPTQAFATMYPIPVILTYQVSTWSRYPRHDRQIINALFSPTRLPLRFGLIYIPQDNTVRRVDVVGFAKRDTTDENVKRLFNNIYTIQIASEFLTQELVQLYEVTQSPNITYTQIDQMITNPNLQE